MLRNASITTYILARTKLEPQSTTTAARATVPSNDFSPSIHFSQKLLSRAHLDTAEFRTTQNPPQLAMYAADALHSHFSVELGKCSFQAAA